MSSSGSDDFFEDEDAGSEPKAGKLEDTQAQDPKDNSSDGDKYSNDESESSASDTNGGDSESRENSVNDEEDDIQEDVQEEREESESDDEAEDGDGGNESEELENLFNGSPSPTCSSTPAPASTSVLRPTSANSPMEVFLRSQSSSTLLHDDTLGGDTVVARAMARREATGLVPTVDAPLLLVTRTPVHDRPATTRGARDSASPRPPCSTRGAASPRSTRTARGPQLTANIKGINQIITIKERSSTQGGKRPSSADSWCPEPGHSSTTQPRIKSAATADMPRQRPLGKYARSLEMLGVKLPSQHLRDHRAGQRSWSSQSWKSSGKLHTRVAHRTTSLEDVTRVIPQVNTPDALHELKIDECQRATLSQAVYEEWYFRRCKEIRSNKLKAKDKIMEEERKKEKVKKDLEVKVRAAVSEWEEKKKQQKIKAREKLKEEAHKKDKEKRLKEETQMKVTAAVIAWEMEKNELARMRREKKRLEAEAQREKERKKCSDKKESEMVFQMWKQQKIEEEKEKRRKKKEEEEELRREKEREELDKKQGAELAFEAWRRNKLQEAHENMRKYIMDSQLEKSSEAKRRIARSTEALKAYEEWLDKVEEREPLRGYQNARASVMAHMRPPWCPGGSSNSLLGC
nr:microtubule-associated protein 9-like [Cherax quadricarinatus]